MARWAGSNGQRHFEQRFVLFDHETRQTTTNNSYTWIKQHEQNQPITYTLLNLQISETQRPNKEYMDNNTQISIQ